jgi:TRAP-type C4-dicarboxylate transport system permease small subunit
MSFDDPVGRLLDGLARAFAVVGGLALTATALMCLYSVVMRNLAGAPIVGDFELAQMGCAVSVGAFMPFTQLRNGNIFVDFFTQRASARTRSRLDGFGALVVAAAFAVLAWRTGLGAMDALRNDETTMIMGLPIWWGYACLAPSFALSAAAAAYSAWRHWALREPAQAGESA